MIEQVSNLFFSIIVIWRRMKTTFMSIDKSEDQVPATWKRKIKMKYLFDNDTTKIKSSYIN